MTDEEWAKILEKFTTFAVEYQKARYIADSIGIAEPTVKRILTGKKPSFMMQLRIDDWVKKQERKIK